MNEISKNSGLRMPAEWEAHDAVWLAWPYDKTTFGSLNQKDNKVDPGRLSRVEETFVNIINALGKTEKVKLITRDGNADPRIKENVEIFKADYADVWTRDYMPSFVKNEKEEIVAIKWIYNAYGEKFNELLKDNGVWGEINKELKIKTIDSVFVIESGAIDVNGRGVLLTTEQCVFNRNPNLNKDDVENVFAKNLGISRVIWLKRGLVNDHTDGHVDEIARFVSPSKILCAFEDDPKENNFKILHENYEMLKNSTDENGNLFEVVKLPIPHFTYDNGTEAPASYTNFYIGNKVVLASMFNDKNDARALEIIQECFPDKNVIGIDCRELIYGGGAIHCVTQQEI